MLCARSFILQHFPEQFHLHYRAVGGLQFADDNTIFSCGNSFEAVASTLEEDLSKSMYWFKTNQMVLNTSKFQVILFGLNSNENIVLEVGGCCKQFYPIVGKN